MKRKRLVTVLIMTAVVLAGCGTEKAVSNTETSEDTETSENTSVSAGKSGLDVTTMFTERDKEMGYEADGSAAIQLLDDASSCDSDAVQIDGNTITITDEGTYLLSGKLTDGMVIVNAEKTDKVQLVLNGAEITNADSAAIYVLCADKVFVTTASDSENCLVNGGTYTAIDENQIDAVIFSKEDLTLNGTGTLQIQAGAGHGIVSKDDLVLTGGTYEITAEKQGISGKNSVRIADGTYTITAGTDGVHASNTDDTSLGYVYIEGGTFDIVAEDDGIHADLAAVIAGGTIEIEKSYEGIEGLSIDITGGEISLTSSDDGLNAAGGTDSSGMETMGPGEDIFASEEGAYINISGGKLKVNASGDGIDSNGELIVSGGETYVSGPTNDGNGALDYAGNAEISGGIFVAAGTSGMAQNFGEDSTQGVMLVNVDAQETGTPIILTAGDGSELISYTPEKEYNSVIISCPEITTGETYTLTAGNSTQEITMDRLIYGTGGMGGGRPGQDRGMQPGGQPGQNRGQDEGMSPDGQPGQQPGKNL